MSGIQKLNLKEGNLDNMFLDFEVILVDSGRKFKLEDRDVFNLLQRKYGVSPAVAGGTFSGVLDVSKVQDIFYTDYNSGSAVTLSLSTEAVFGAACTVRVQGDLTNALPATWRFSGDTLSTASGEWNELTVLYISADDTRIVNRVFTK